MKGESGWESISDFAELSRAYREALCRVELEDGPAIAALRSAFHRESRRLGAEPSSAVPEPEPETPPAPDPEPHTGRSSPPLFQTWTILWVAVHTAVARIALHALFPGAE